jgi:biopolymer transport protein ExbD
MKLKTNHTISPQFNMSSMTDIIFLLLIFFMLSASFVAPTSLPIDLPASHTNQTVTPQVQISITATLDYYVGTQQTTLSELESILREKLPSQDGLVLLQADRSVPIEYIIKVVDIAGSLNAQVSIATRADQ